LKLCEAGQFYKTLENIGSSSYVPKIQTATKFVYIKPFRSNNPKHMRNFLSLHTIGTYNF